jgi:hypothetical protein
VLSKITTVLLLTLGKLFKFLEAFFHVKGAETQGGAETIVFFLLLSKGGGEGLVVS